jgi:prevent-host-death family protein
MNSFGIREAKAHLSALARAAANGEPTLLTDYGKPIAVIVSAEGGGVTPANRSSDPLQFREALLALPYGLEGLEVVF